MKKRKSLSETHPEIAKEWNFQLNGDLKPENITFGSNKKVWWTCIKNQEHIWQATVNNRTNKGSKCPYCNGRVNEENNLTITHPEVADEWDYELNEGYKPTDFTYGSDQKINWICKKNKSHKWNTSINNRTMNQSGCPYCAGKVATKDNNLKVLYPEIANEWDYSSNGGLKPENFLPRSKKKINWKCVKGHKWKAKISDRTIGTNCPKCYNQSSRLELFIFAELKHLFEQAKHRFKIDGTECDIYLPEINLAIEIDGSYWHSLDKDIKKNNHLKDCGVKLLRIREHPLEKIENLDIVYKKDKSYFAILKKILKKIAIFDLIGSAEKQKITAYMEENKPQNDKLYREMIFSTKLDENLAKNYPEIAKEWDYEKNYPQEPENFTPHSHEKVAWKCKKGHKWIARIKDRTRGRGCPYCSNKKAHLDNCLATINPELAKEWHPFKNGDLTPNDVLPGSKKDYWWICKKNHEWKASVYSRNNRQFGCPYCSGKKVCFEDSLENLYPELAKEWHPFKNGSVKPGHISPKSERNVWWICKKNHEWKYRIKNVVQQGYTCPYCLENE